ncbi:hypothetical protein GCM10023231_00080 [Olivibacter ginsenosidimutans]|uniref:Family 43 glycosylhydrolase n=1 Tax=Olivibacter ginsenosidimutans TaxID=1176537 RepID=A0ABP9ABB0_9SPHI
MWYYLSCLSFLFCIFQGNLIAQNHATVVNFDENGHQVVKFTADGEAVDAHDGEIAYFDGVYYLYGTSYGCGFAWNEKEAPFCGFKVYASSDMVHWTDKGFLFDANTSVWQCRCDGSTYGCFRPHVIFNKQTQKYILWVNVYDNRVGFRVFTSTSPTGPFKEEAEPTLAVNNDAPVAGLNNGDHDTFVDDDGTAYLAYTDWRTGGTIVIEELNKDYLSGTGRHVKTVTKGKTEAPGLFKRKGIYYITYSDPNCGYCSGTGTSYRTAKSPLGPWSTGIKISDNSCGGQPSFVSTLALPTDTVYLYGSDLWNNAAKNEALANFYWSPLEFDQDGAIRPMRCVDQFQLPLHQAADTKKTKHNPSSSTISSGIAGFHIRCGIDKDTQWLQGFTATSNGILDEVSITTFKNGYPDADLLVAIYRLGTDVTPQGEALYTLSVSADSLKWSPNYFTFQPRIPVSKNTRYAIVLKSATQKGCYGLASRQLVNDEKDSAAHRSSQNTAFSEEKNQLLMFRAQISKK